MAARGFSGVCFALHGGGFGGEPGLIPGLMTD